MTGSRRKTHIGDRSGRAFPERLGGSRAWFWAGLLAAAASILPNVILGQDSIVTYHDQLDGEMIAYILQAKHLFAGDVLPEFMGGMGKTALTVPAPVCVLLFLGGNPFAALLAMQLAGKAAGFIGMYLLARETAEYALVAVAAGVLYALLPFLPVYGLSQYGIPLLFWCIWQIRQKKRLAISYGYAALYALASSLILVGFAILGMLGLAVLWELRRSRCPGKGGILRLLSAWLLLAGIYVAENIRLLFQLLGRGRYVSHKQEYVLRVMPFWDALRQNLWEGGQHSEAFQGLLVSVVLAAAVAGWLACRAAGRRGDAGRAALPEGMPGRKLHCMVFCLAWNVFFACTAAVWGGAAVVGLRSRMGSFGAFQLDRVLWVAPCLWYLAAACGTAYLCDLWPRQKEAGRRAVAGIALAAAVLAAGITGVRILLAGDIKTNLQKLRMPEYGMMSYSDYYGIGVMEQVRDFLAEQTGKGQEEYRVVSLGIDPAAALYHGFYCLDGYSNNYDLEYKRGFRRIIAPELEKNEYLRTHFDGWGNRCYLFSAECPGYYTIEKGGFFFQEYRLDTEALREMGGRYLFSAAYIQDAAGQGLRLMREAPFETEDSYYRIFLYEVEEGR